jgi:hypothetical protein
VTCIYHTPDRNIRCNHPSRQRPNLAANDCLQELCPGQAPAPELWELVARLEALECAQPVPSEQEGQRIMGWIPVNARQCPGRVLGRPVETALDAGADMALVCLGPTNEVE